MCASDHAVRAGLGDAMARQGEHSTDGRTNRSGRPSLSCSALITTQSRAAVGPSLTLWLFFGAHFHDLLHQRGTMSDISVPGGRIRSFIERIETLDSELQELNEQKKEVFSEAKGEGFDVKILKEIIKLRKQDQDERDEHETLLEVYLRAIETAEKEPQAKAA
jgi:uncharacterized protein (UPF0335 family)